MNPARGTVTAREAGEGVALIEVTSGVPATAEDRARQLTDQVFAVIEALVAAVSHGAAVVVVDVRMEVGKGDAAWPNAQAFLHAVRGLVQSLTREREAPAPAVNVVVSTSAEADDRARTIAYLASADGRFSLGTTYDLRRNR